MNPNAEDEKAARAARDVRSEARSEHVGDSAGERVEVSYRAAIRRDRPIATGSERAESRAGGVTPEYVADVRGMVAGIEERRQVEALEGQAERLGEAAQDIVNGARQLEQTAAGVNRLDAQLEREAGRLSEISLSQRKSDDFQLAVRAFSEGLSKQEVIALLAKDSLEAQRRYREQGSTLAYYYIEEIATVAQRASQQQLQAIEKAQLLKKTKLRSRDTEMDL